MPVVRLSFVFGFHAYEELIIQNPSPWSQCHSAILRDFPTVGVTLVGDSKDLFIANTQANILRISN